MKTLLRIAAVLSFLFCSVSGGSILAKSLSLPYEDLFILSALGLFLVGMAFFFGAVLLVAAEKLGRNVGSK